MDLKDMLTALAPYVPLFQTLVWAIVVIIIATMLRKQIRRLMDTLADRLKAGSSLEIGGVKLGPEPLVTKTSDLDEKKVKIFGNPDRFVLLFKAKSDDWARSTKAMEVTDGCVVQVSTERKNPDGTWAIAEALTFVSGAIVTNESQGSGHYLTSAIK
jgi:hypothetical protein